MDYAVQPFTKWNEEQTKGLINIWTSSEEAMKHDGDSNTNHSHNTGNNPKTPQKGCRNKTTSVKTARILRRVLDL